MRRLILLTSIVILFSPLYSFAKNKADTIDYWHVYYNKNVINKFSLIDKNPTVIIQKKLVRSNDVLGIYYGHDSACYECEIGIYIKDDASQKTYLVKSKGVFNILKIPVSKLLAIAKQKNNYDFNLYYYDSNHRNTLIFHLKIE